MPNVYLGVNLVFQCEDSNFETLGQLFSEIETSLDIKRDDYRLHWGCVKLVDPYAQIADYWGTTPAILTIHPHFTWKSLWNSFHDFFSRPKYQRLET